MPITKEQIIETAERLQAEGTNPTQTNVREALGGGSFATIGPILKAWKESEKEDHALAEVHIPDAIAERFEQMQGALWTAAINEAERRLAAEREALKELQESARLEVAEATEAVQILEAEQEELKNQLAASADEIQKVQSELADYKDRLMNLRQETSQALSDRTAKIESLTATVAELRKSLEKEEKRSESLETKSEQQHKEHQDKIDAIRKDHQDELKTMQSEHRDSLAAEAKKVEQLENQNKHLSARSEHAEARLEGAHTEIEQHRTATAKMREKLEAAQQEAAELRGELKALQAAKKPQKDKDNG